jgi:hypothetical protein
MMDHWVQQRNALVVRLVDDAARVSVVVVVDA